MSECVCLFLNSSKTTEPDELKFLVLISLGLKTIRIRRTVSRKIACIVSWKLACILATLAVNFIFSSMNLQHIWEVGRGWRDQ